MVVMKKSNLCIQTKYFIIEYLEEIHDEIRFIGRDGKYDVYFGKHDDIYFVESKEITTPSIRLTNAEWKIFLSEQFRITKTMAAEMLHVMMRWKSMKTPKMVNDRKDAE